MALGPRLHPLGRADRLELRATDAGANVLLVEPYDEVVFERTLTRDELVTSITGDSR